MFSANECYIKAIKILQAISSESSLKIFLQKQFLSIMQGIQISDIEKIKSMMILLNAAALIDPDISGNFFNKTDQLFLEVSGEYKDNIANSRIYIDDLLYHQADISELKIKYKRKPWLVFDNSSSSNRISRGLVKPESNLPGSDLIPTKNGNGWEFPMFESDIYVKQFLKNVSGDFKKSILILGAGYGTLVYNLLENTKHSKSRFVVNDLSAEHLEIFKDQLPKEFDNRVTVISGDFLEEVSFPTNHFDYILLQNVMHFFTPEQVDVCLERIYLWLKNGGSLTVTTSTPYIGSLIKYVSVFQQKKQIKDPSPGFIVNFKKFLEEQNDPMASIVPDTPIHVFDDETLVSRLSKNNFQLGQVGFFAMPKTFPKPFQGNGSEYVGAEVYKP